MKKQKVEDTYNGVLSRCFKKQEILRHATTWMMNPRFIVGEIS